LEKQEVEVHTLRKENEIVRFENKTIGEELKKRLDINIRNERKIFAIDRKL